MIAWFVEIVFPSITEPSKVTETEFPVLSPWMRVSHYSITWILLLSSLVCPLHLERRIFSLHTKVVHLPFHRKSKVDASFFFSSINHTRYSKKLHCTCFFPRPYYTHFQSESNLESSNCSRLSRCLPSSSQFNFNFLLCRAWNTGSIKEYQ